MEFIMAAYRPVAHAPHATAGQRHHSCSGTQGIRIKANHKRSEQAKQKKVEQ
tara:strand:- start:921 stop:1076 length:156 start_codon:yes stop_codon:yes gene_type:complete